MPSGKATSYYYSSCVQSLGTVGGEHLQQFAIEGKIAVTELIWKDMSKKGVLAAKVKGIFVSPPLNGDVGKVADTELQSKKVDSLEIESVEPIVFVSHSALDINLAMQIVNSLESVGILCWIAPRNITPGYDYNAQITVGIRSSKALIVLESRNSIVSDQVTRELDAAANRRIPIIPVRIESIQRSDAFEHLLRTYQWIDAFPPPLDDHLAKIVSGVKQALKQHLDSPRKQIPFGPSKEELLCQSKMTKTLAGIFAIAILVFMFYFLVRKTWETEDSGTNSTKAASPRREGNELSKEDTIEGKLPLDSFRLVLDTIDLQNSADLQESHSLQDFFEFSHRTDLPFLECLFAEIPVLQGRTYSIMFSEEGGEFPEFYARFATEDALFVHEDRHKTQDIVSSGTGQKQIVFVAKNAVSHVKCFFKFYYGDTTETMPFKGRELILTEVP